jgi:hypothetical protein
MDAGPPPPPPPTCGMFAGRVAPAAPVAAAMVSLTWMLVPPVPAASSAFADRSRHGVTGSRSSRGARSTRTTEELTERRCGTRGTRGRVTAAACAAAACLEHDGGPERTQAARGARVAAVRVGAWGGGTSRSDSNGHSLSRAEDARGEDGHRDGTAAAAATAATHSTSSLPRAGPAAAPCTDAHYGDGLRCACGLRPRARCRKYLHVSRASKICDRLRGHTEEELVANDDRPCGRTFLRSSDRERVGGQRGDPHDFEVRRSRLDARRSDDDVVCPARRCREPCPIPRLHNDSRPRSSRRRGSQNRRIGTISNLVNHLNLQK